MMESHGKQLPGYSKKCKCAEIHDALADGHPNPEGYMECADKDGHLPDCPLHKRAEGSKSGEESLAATQEHVAPGSLSSPPSDTALREALLAHENKVVDMTLACGEKLDYVYSMTAVVRKSREVLLALYAHPEDAPSFLSACSFCGYTAICSAHQHADPTCKTCFGERAVEDAPGGPLDTERLAREMAGDPDAPVGNLMIDTMEAWVLRALDRLKGEGK